MDHRIVIKYAAVKPSRNEQSAPICSIFQPGNAAADMRVFDGTYYDTNVKGWGEGTPIDVYVGQMIAYPKLGAYLREAVREGSYEFQTNDEAMYLYLKECAPALAPQGFTFTFA